ncbi:hypothetical protein LTV02_18340 [Nocardia yamanashiensis]|uniref:hypothetical protein n=1 Tax=Nocardia yamanashiensis TaxID=209247 RepID=UPI001E3F8EB4|nr:hypothetical protein [Nocardia yamanashiensis]UGT45222.1 hypothetical protein LTV02_18340 [Nocardia yamanashiensis]
MNDIVTLLAACAALAAAGCRLPRWRAVESRPLTIGLGLLGLFALLRAPVLNAAATDVATSATTLESLPDLISNLSLVAAGALIGVAITDAFGSAAAKKTFYVFLILVEAALLLTYEPSKPYAAMIDAHKWILAGAGVVTSIAILVAAFLSISAIPARLRLPLGLFMLGGALSLGLSIVRVVTLLRPDGAQVEVWAPWVSVPIFAFAFGSLIGTYRVRTLDPAAAARTES